MKECIYRQATLSTCHSDNCKLKEAETEKEKDK